MVTSCYAINCTSRVGSVSHGEKITFHRFPQKPELRRLWTAAVKRYDPVTKKQWEPKKHACLCSEHFAPEDFRYNRGYRLIRDGAIPTRFNYLTTKSNKAIEPRKKEVNRDVAPEPTASPVLPSNLDDTVPKKPEKVSKTNNSKSNNYSEWLLENLFSRRTQDIFCDTVLIIGKQQLKAHSVVLSAGSTFFHSALKLYSKPGLRYLTLPGIGFDVLQIAVRFIYTGKFEVGTKYVKSDQRAELLNTLRKLGLNLEHLEECEIIHNSDEEEVITGSLKMRNMEGKKVQDRAESSSAHKRSSRADGVKVQDRAESSSANKQSSRMDGAKVQDRAESSSANKRSSRMDGVKVQDRAESSSGSKQSSRADSAKVQDSAESSSVNKQSSRAVSCDIVSKSVVPVKAKNSLDQSSLVSSSLHAGEIEGDDVADVGCDVASTPAETSIASECRTPVDCNSVLSEVNNGWVLRSKTGVHFVEVPRELLAEIELGSRKSLPNQTGGKVLLDSSQKKSFHSTAKKVRVDDGDVAVVHPRRILPRPGPICSASAVDPVHEEVPRPGPSCSASAVDPVHEELTRPGPSCSASAVDPVHEELTRPGPSCSASAVDPVHEELTRPGPSCSASAVDPVHEELPIVKQKRQKQENHACPFCGKAFFGKSHYEVHLRTHTGEKPYPCKSCGKSFAFAGNLRRHMRCHAGHRSHLCDFCGRAFIEKSTLDDHVASRHTKEKKHMCTSCGKFFPTLGCYRAHSKRCGNIKFRREYTTLSEPMRLLYEEAVLTASTEGASRFVCRICKKDYATKSILTLHLKQHTIAKPFVCNLCQKSFWQRSRMDIHERMHTGERPFICGTCGKGFISRGRLGIHEMQHSGKKPYNCVTCGSSFSLPAYLKIHMRNHNDDRPHECKLCGKKYRKEINLQSHLNRAHHCNENS